MRVQNKHKPYNSHKNISKKWKQIEPNLLREKQNLDTCSIKINLQRMNHQINVVKKTQSESDNSSVSSPIKTKTKYYRKLLNFYDSVKSPKKRAYSASSPSKSPQKHSPMSNCSSIKVELDITEGCKKLMKFATLMNRSNLSTQTSSRENVRPIQSRSRILHNLKALYAKQCVRSQRFKNLDKSLKLEKSYSYIEYPTCDTRSSEKQDKSSGDPFSSYNSTKLVPKRTLSQKYSKNSKIHRKKGMIRIIY
mmetsp:Transcript_533/g.473  ORF Transcript_533/g.473 Transcript_533/m.473 type:complete len:250 (+) Transcript_533:148-897(+)